MTIDSKTAMSNINLVWASLIIEELIRHNITDFCIAPGSRSTPLTLAVANHKKAESHIHFDERGLAFLALGLCQSTQKPVVIITTSGTAVANLYPAIIEARESGLSLIILSADRPADLLNCGANQAIEQHSIFANYPVFFAQIVQPTTAIKPNYLLTTIDQGLHQQQIQQGPIHFNIAFSEPLYPTTKTQDYQHYLSSLKSWLTTNNVFTENIQQQNTTLPPDKLLDDKKVFIILGKLNNSVEEEAISLFAKTHNIPLLADIQSSKSSAPANLPHFDLLLVNEYFHNLLQQAEVVIQFGEQVVSKRLLLLLNTFNGELHLIANNNKRIDPNHQLTKRFHCPATQWITAQKINTINTHWSNLLRKQHDFITGQVITPFLKNEPLSELTVVTQLDKLLPLNSPLFISNSMPIRLSNMLMKQSQAEVFSNRGASGIDGIIATAVGVAKKRTLTTTLLIGDTSFLYDLNSLSLIKQLSTPFIIIVINNDGGAIFNLLPVPEKEKKIFYQLPHGLNFKASCEQFDINYYNPNQLVDFKAIYNRCLQGKNSLIEITLENQQTSTQLIQLKEQIKNATL